MDAWSVTSKKTNRNEMGDGLSQIREPEIQILNHGLLPLDRAATTFLSRILRGVGYGQ